MDLRSSIVWNREAKPASVLGGKNSNETVGRPNPMIRSIRICSAGWGIAGTLHQSGQEMQKSERRTQNEANTASSFCILRFDFCNSKNNGHRSFRGDARLFHSKLDQRILESVVRFDRRCQLVVRIVTGPHTMVGI